MGELAKSLSEHTGAILILCGGLISGMITIISWFIKRTLGKLEANCDDMLKTIIRHDRYLERIITSHQHNHQQDLRD
jgi:hypothetical protein